VTYIGIVRHTHRDGSDRRFAQPDDPADRRHGRHHHHGNRFGSRRGGRPFDYGELRLLVLAMIAEQPRHGYELMKAIEERMSGSYSPSPGVIYPTLTMLAELDYVTVTAADGAKKLYEITAEGRTFLRQNRATVDEVMARMREASASERASAAPPILRAIENLKVALRLRQSRGPLTSEQIRTIASALDKAAVAIEES
jgi:DNA-binding PadR family transcriptional regulator